MRDEISPERLDLLLDGDASPETQAERDLLNMAAALVASEPDSLPAGLDAAIDTIPMAAGRPGFRTWLGTRRGRLMLGAAPVAAAMVAALVFVSLPNGTPAPRSWTDSSELAGSSPEGTPTDLLSATAPRDGETTPPPFVETGGRPLRTRSGPGASFAERGTLADGASVTITCTARGSEVLGVFGESDLWNQLADGRWVSDAFIFTDTDSPAAPPCR